MTRVRFETVTGYLGEADLPQEVSPDVQRSWQVWMREFWPEALFETVDGQLVRLSTVSRVWEWPAG